MTFQELMDAYKVNDVLCNEASYDALLEQMKTDRITPVIGAGLSCWAGYPLWGRLLSEKAKGIPAQKTIERLLSEEKYEEAAQKLEDFYERAEFLDTLRKSFSPAMLKEENRPDYQLLLDKLFPGPFVTTNYDVSLERLLKESFVITPESDFHNEETKRRVQQHKRMVVKLHGTVEDPNHMILTESSYNSSYGDDPAHPDFSKPLPDTLKTIFQSGPPLFLGCGLGPDRTCAVLRACKGAMGFALMELPAETENKAEPLRPILTDAEDFLPSVKARRKQLSSLGLKVIWYPRGHHEAIAVLIKKLDEDLGIKGPTGPCAGANAAEKTAYRGSRFFLGRDALVKTVVDWLNTPDDPILLVHGAPGIGKTEICKAAYRKRKEDDPSFSMPLIDLAGVSDLASFLERLSTGLGLSLKDTPPEAMLGTILSYLGGTARKVPPMVYLDNFEDIWNVLSAENQGKLSDHLELLSASGLRLLISSQARLPVGRYVPVRPLDGSLAADRLSRLSWDEFLALDRVRLFMHHLDRQIRPDEQEALRRLTAEMEGHPLSIVLTACYGRTCASLNELVQDWSDITYHIPGQPVRQDSLVLALALVWKGAQKNRAAVLRWALHSCSIFSLGRATVNELRGVLEESFTNAQWREGGRVLRTLSVVEDTDDGREQMLLTVKKTFAGLSGETAAARGAALSVWAAWGDALLSAGDDRKHPDYLRLHDRALQWLPQVFYLAEQCLETGSANALEKLLRSAGNYYQFDTARAIPLLDQLIREAPRNHPLIGSFYERYGDLLSRTGKLDEALAAYDEAEGLYEQEQANLGRANVLKSRGGIEQNRQEWELAISFYQKALELYRRERDSMNQCYILSELQLCESRLGKDEEAEQHIREAMGLLSSQPASVQGYVLRKIIQAQLK